MTCVGVVVQLADGTYRAEDSRVYCACDLHLRDARALGLKIVKEYDYPGNVKDVAR